MKKSILATWDGFVGLAGRTLYNLTEKSPKWGGGGSQVVLMMQAHGSARAPRMRASSTQLGSSFGLVGTRKVKNQGQPSNRALNMVFCACRACPGPHVLVLSFSSNI